jgi:cobalt-zinc-cadmium efflux system outer membrane protein
MRRPVRRLIPWFVFAGCLAPAAPAQTAVTWEQVRARFAAANPAVRAGQLTIDEARASEITAYLRPNPGFAASLDQLQPFTASPYQPLTGAFPMLSLNYLHERNHQRELRRDSAREATGITVFQQDDLIRNLLFSLRNAFVQALQAKSVLALAKDNLDYFDRELSISRDRFRAGDIAQLDLSRLELQRVQYESDFQTALVNLRTAKIQLLQLLADRTPVDQFEVAGPFDFSDRLMPLEEFRAQAMVTRPDLKAAAQAIQRAQTDHQLAVANGSTDPTFSFDAGHNPPFDAYIGFSVSIPLRIFDRNQGEKQRTQLDIGRDRQLTEAARAQVFGDVDSAYAQVNSNLILLRPYKEKYLKMALDVRDMTSFSFQHGQASLLDFLDAQRDYRQVEVTYLNLVAAYLTAASQLNLAVGREVIS